MKQKGLTRLETVPEKPIGFRRGFKRRQMKFLTGFTFSEILITGAVFSVVLVLGTLLMSMERARTRDAVRVADMTRLAGAFGIFYAQEASYAPAAAGCAKVGDLVSACTLSPFVPSLGALKDPGRFDYTVVRVPDADDYAVKFQLERNYRTLKAGPHILTKAGIQ